MTVHIGPWLALATSLLLGCASQRNYEARGNFIVVARFDSRYAGGGEPRVVTDNAAGLPSLAAGAAGMPTSAAGGAALNVGVAAAINFLASEAAKGTIPIAFKVIYEKDCQYDQVTVDLRKSPDSEKLYPGYVGKITRSDAGHTQMLPIHDARGDQAYLTKSAPCYDTWVKEWRQHQLVMQTRPVNWGVHNYLISRKSVDEMPYPDLPWVK
jgi:hypothetical protein